MQILSNLISASNVCESLKFSHLLANRVKEHDGDFRPEVEIRLFGACETKNMQYNPYLWPNRRYFRVLKEVEVEQRDCDVRFKSGSGNMAISCMRNASGHNYSNSLFIVDLAMEPIPRSTERISSCKLRCSKYLWRTPFAMIAVTTSVME